MKQLNKTTYNFSVFLLIQFCIILMIFLNKKESKVICMREFEIILLQTQSLSIKPFKELISFIKNTLKRFAKRLIVVEFYLKLKIILRI